MKQIHAAALFALGLAVSTTNAAAETPDIPEAIEQCIDNLSQIEVPPPFAGISDADPGQAPLAAVANWQASVTPLHWIDPRSGVLWEFGTSITDIDCCFILFSSVYYRSTMTHRLKLTP